MNSESSIFRQLSIFALPALAGLLVVMSSVYWVQLIDLKESQAQQILNTQTQIKTGFNQLLSSARSDMKFLARHPESTAEQIYAAFLQQHPQYLAIAKSDAQGNWNQIYTQTDFSLAEITFRLSDALENSTTVLSRGGDLKGIGVAQAFENNESGFLVLILAPNYLADRLIDTDPFLLGRQSSFWDLNGNQLTDKLGNSTGFSLNQYWNALLLNPGKSLQQAKSALKSDLAFLSLLFSIIVLTVSFILAKSRLQRIKERQYLAESERLNKSIVETSMNAIVTLDFDGTVRTANPAAVKLIMRNLISIQGKTFESVFLHEDEKAHFNQVFSTILQQPATSHTETLPFRLQNAAGDVIPVNLVLGVDQYHGSRIINAFITDKSDQIKNIELQILTEKVFVTASEGIVITDANNRIEAVNPSFSRITGYSDQEVIGKNPKFLSSGKHDQHFYEIMWAELLMKGIWKGEVWNRKKSGLIFPEELSISVVRDNQGGIRNYIAIFHDITERKSREERIAYQAHYDQLTGLPNRFVFLENLDDEIKGSKRLGDGFALLFIDLNDFKQINDTLGHQIGDLVLEEAARRLQDAVRGSDMVARLAGDEFTIIIRSLSSDEDLDNIIDKIQSDLDGPFQTQSGDVMITGSIGGVRYSDQFSNSDELLHAADQAMYQAKKKKVQ